MANHARSRPTWPAAEGLLSGPGVPALPGIRNQFPLASDAGLSMVHRHLVTEALQRRAAWRVTEELGTDEAATPAASVSDLHWCARPLLVCTCVPSSEISVDRLKLVQV